MKKILYTLLLVGLSVGMNAQDKIAYLNYNWGSPSGDTRDFIETNSWKGFNFGVATFVTNRVTVGGNIAWNSFYEKTNKRTYSSGNTDVTGTMWRYLYSMPIHITGQYYVTSPNNPLALYVGASMGPNYVQQEIQIGQFFLKDNQWKFSGKVEAGLYYQFPQSNWGIHSNFTYTFMGYNDWNIQTLAYSGVSLGFITRFD